MPDAGHVPVLVEPAVRALLSRPDGVYVDGTFGRGGHARALLALLGPTARLVGIDRDPDAEHAARALDDPRFTFRRAWFSECGDVLDALGIEGIDGALLDLGISSPQIDDPSRGFSFRFDGPLDMRMDTARGETAAAFLARASVGELAEVLRDYGEERLAQPIAAALVAARAREPITRTGQLRELVRQAVGARTRGDWRQDPATRTFQALRIQVNAELAELPKALVALARRLVAGGRLAVISFHSLEDRIVKTFIARESRTEVDRRAPFAAEPPHRLRALARVKPGPAETAANPRARSAVMRVAERTGVPLAAGVQA